MKKYLIYWSDYGFGIRWPASWDFPLPSHALGFSACALVLMACVLALAAAYFHMQGR